MDVLVTGPVFEAIGYAEILRNITLGLSRLGANIKLEPRGLGQSVAVLSAAEESALKDMIANSSCNPRIALHVTLAGLFRPIAGMFNIGLTMLEVDRLPREWVDRCNLMNEVWVPSSFNLGTFSASGVRRDILKVMPLGVSTSRFNPHGGALEVPGLRGYVFLSVFEWILRKGYDILVPAFLAEFAPDEDVSLLLRVHDNSNYDPAGSNIRSWLSQVAASFGRDVSQIVVLSSVLPSELMPALYRRASCFVLPTRGEGWNMPAIEAMATGLPVVSTAWSGQMEFLQPAGAYLIEVEKLEPVPVQGIANDRVYGGALWAKPSASHLRRLMRYVFENREEAAKLGISAWEFVRRNYSWEVSTTRMYARLNELTS